MPAPLVSKREKYRGHYYYVLRNQEGKVLKRTRWSSDPVKRSKAKNQIQTHSQKKFWESTKAKKILKKSKEKQSTLQEPSLTAFQTLQKIKQKIDKYPDITTLGKTLDKKGIKNFKVNVRTEGRIDNNKLYKKYYAILKDKVKDKKEIKELIIHRAKTLKHRLALKITIYIKNKAAATIDIGGILLEQDVNAHNYWEGRYVESNTLGLHAEEFRSLIKNPRIYVVRILRPEPGTITKIDTAWSFA